jgi:alpha-L-fucosidase
MFERDVTAGGVSGWQSNGRSRGAELHVELPARTTVGIVRLEEMIEHGQNVRGYRVLSSPGSGEWNVLCQGTTIGYTKLNRVAPTPVKRLRVLIDTVVERPEPVTIRVYAS